MGAWGLGPFENDGAADFLDEVSGSPSRVVTRTLQRIAKKAPGRNIDVDDGTAGWAACELVALAFGRGETDALDDNVLDAVAKLPAKEEQRLLALEVLARIAVPETSELAALWHEGHQGKEGARFDALVDGLRARLTAASAGPLERTRAKKGDVIALSVAAGATELFVVQVVGPGEVAVFSGTWMEESVALAALKTCLARRVPTAVAKLLRRGRLLGHMPVRKDLSGRKLYAGETGSFVHYALSTANGGDLQIVSYDQARDHDLLLRYGEESLRSIALGTKPVERLRSVDEREAELRTQHASKWAARRKSTTPGPFGDVAVVAGLVEWIEEFGIQNAIERSHDVATGMQGYGRPEEGAERRSYAFAALVALWRGALSKELWPPELADRLPARPAANLMTKALAAARTLADEVLTPDAELRLIWDEAADEGAELRRWVADLQRALA